MSGYVRVINLRRDMAPDSQPEPGETVFAVDRTHPVLGNRHVLRNKLNRAEREGVLAAYRTDLEQDLAAQGPMYAEIEKLAERVRQGERICLACWCRPLPCHADLIEKAVNRTLGR
jgi:hypothetical protein